jgi:hypothetical protein
MIVMVMSAMIVIVPGVTMVMADVVIARMSHETYSAARGCV